MTNDERAQQVSALLDGELEREERETALDALCGDDELRQRWAAYNLIGDVLRADRVAADGLAVRVRATLETEPELPRELRPVPQPAAGRSWIKPVAGLALAASLATVAVLGGRSFEQAPATGTQLPVASLDATDTAAVANGAPTPDAPRTLQFAAAGSNRMQWSTPQPAVQQRLNAYLVDYSDYLGTDLRGMLPYARVVGYDGRQP